MIFLVESVSREADSADEQQPDLEESDASQSNVSSPRESSQEKSSEERKKSTPREPTAKPAARTPSADEEFETTSSSSHANDEDSPIEQLRKSRKVQVNDDLLANVKQEELNDAIRQNENLETLAISSAPDLMDNKLLEKVLNAASAKESIKHLEISDCGSLTDESGKIIADYVRKQSKLESITIVDVDLFDTGVQHVLDAIEEKYKACKQQDSDSIYDKFKLRSLRLVGCGISDDGVVAVGKLLSEDPPIDTVYLVRCDTDVSVKAWTELCNMLADNTELTKLDISGCMIGDEKLRAVCEGLKRNKALQVLAIRTNLSNGDCTDAVLDLIKTHPKLKTVEFVVGNNFSSEQIAEIDQLLSRKAAGHLDD